MRWCAGLLKTAARSTNSNLDSIATSTPQHPNTSTLVSSKRYLRYLLIQTRTQCVLAVEYFLSERSDGVKLFPSSSPLRGDATEFGADKSLVFQSLQCHVHRADVDLFFQFLLEIFQDEHAVCFIVISGYHEKDQLLKFTQCMTLTSHDFCIIYF